MVSLLKYLKIKAKKDQEKANENTIICVLFLKILIYWSSLMV